MQEHARPGQPLGVETARQVKTEKCREVLQMMGACWLPRGTAREQEAGEAGVHAGPEEIPSRLESAEQ